MRADESPASAALNDYLALPKGRERDEWLAAMRRSNRSLADEVESLAAFVQEDGFLDRPASPLRLSFEVEGSGITGSVVDGYELLSQIGEGGFGLVFSARRTADGDLNAVVKLLRESLLSSIARKRFEREQEVLRRLDHPGIAKLRATGVLGGGTPYLIMDYIRGTPITEFASREQLSQVERVALVASVLDAIAYAHSIGVVHRDLKPTNLLAFRDSDGKPRAVVIDFGIAKLVTEEPSGVTTTGQTLGTEAYMSPEQIRHPGRDVGPQTDLFSMAVVLAELLLGRLPWQADDLGSFRGSILRDLPDLRSAPGFPALAPPLRAILDRALRKQQDERFPTADEFAAELRRWLEGARVQTKQLSSLFRARHFCRRYPALVLLSLLLGGALITGSVISVRFALLAQSRSRVVQQQQLATALTAASQALRGDDRVGARRFLAQVPESNRTLPWRWLSSLATPSVKLAENLGQARGIAFADGTIAVGSMGGRVTGIDTAGRKLWETAVHSRPVGRLEAFGRSGAMRFASVGSDGALCIIHPASGRIEGRTMVAEDGLSALAIDGHGSRAFVGGGSGLFVAELAANHQVQTPIRVLDVAIAALAAEQHGVVVATRDGELIGLDASTLSERWRVTVGSNHLMGCVWLSGLDLPLLAVSDMSGTLVLVNGSDGTVIGRASLEAGSTHSLRWDPLRQILIVGGRQGVLTLLRVEPEGNPCFVVERSFRGHGSNVQAFLMDHHIYSTSWSGDLVREPVANEAQLPTCPASETQLAAIREDGVVALLCGSTLIRFDPRSGKLAEPLVVPTGSPRGLAWMGGPGDNSLAVLTDAELHLHDGKVWRSQPHTLGTSAALLVAGESQAIAFGNSDVLVAGMLTPGTVHRNLNVLATAATQADGSLWIAASDRTLRRWAFSGDTAKVADLPTTVRWLAARGDHIAALSSDGDVIYSIDRGQVTTIPLTKRMPTAALLCREFRYVVLAYRDGSLDTIDCTTGDAVEILPPSPRRQWMALGTSESDALLALAADGQLVVIAAQKADTLQ
jgi:serine/threonine protein kinase